MPSSVSDPSTSSSQGSRQRVTLSRKILFSSLTIILLFGSVEILLRLAGIGSSQNVEEMEFTFPIDEYNKHTQQPLLVRDETLFWRPRSGVMDHNSHGFYGPEFEIEKKPGVFRIVCLGDSCTHFGPASYPDMLRVYLDENVPGQFEVINAGVIGYTSFQGKRLLETEVLKWAPDLVTVYYGWNDHWLARGKQDKDQDATSSALMTTLREVRLIQLIAMATGRFEAHRRTSMRVEPEDYRDNLRHINELCKTRNIDVWFFTAPHALDHGVPPYLVSTGEVKDAESTLPLHQKYNQIVRDVSEQSGARLIDLAKQMDEMNKAELFLDDHIHLSPTGRLHATAEVIKALVSVGALPNDLEQ
ncbi:SGNH/GDSL hydrolase family protein [Roseiconus lacunae]|uniref:SGNH/GDSL hydrolase family protein n=1 Tax=Roseiconus lacunae TaxID=2605694 RepID=UPI001E6026F7|nr:GDSL-type esterase/lipase family protein [Roseiconus lacunae]MCD0459059.1 GDSL-type esterase/lipase family protein [Roseiconus lacunae]